MKIKVTLICFIFLALVSCKKKTNTDYDYYQPYQKDSLELADSLAKDTVEVIVPIVEIEEKAVVIDRGVDLNDKYFIVLSSYTVKGFAYEMKERMLKQGYNADIFMTNEDGWYKLAIESYNDIDEARTALSNVVAKGEVFANARLVVK